jgi:hypothetical protein
VAGFGWRGVHAHPDETVVDIEEGSWNGGAPFVEIRCTPRLNFVESRFGVTVGSEARNPKP